jgi:isocitrate dehydrogenase (NAD+)
MDGAAERHPEIAYEPVLIDATLAGLVTGAASDSLVIPCLNRDGDLLSDLVLPLFGSIAGAESMLLALDGDLAPRVAMAEAPHGTAPALEGKDVANPMAMILAAAALLHYAGETAAGAGETDAALARVAERASRAIHESVLETVAEGTRTSDLGGHAGTTEFTDAVIALVRRKLGAGDGKTAGGAAGLHSAAPG